MKTLLLLLAMTLSVSAFALGLDNDQAAKNLIMSGRVNHAKGVAIDTQATVDLNSVAGNLVHIAGSTTITSFGTASQAGIQRWVIFDSTPVITYNASTLVTPGNTTLTAAAGDAALVVADSTTKWIILNYQRQATAP